MVNEAAEQRLKLIQQIKDWNENRLDLFGISAPDENNEYFGVMRFFFHEQDGRVSTTCIRVSSTAMCKDVLETLIEKFRPDMRMLTMSKFCLYEVHVNGDERKLNDEDKPLLIQLEWGKDDREGRLLLKREDEKTAFMEGFHTNHPEQNSFKRKLSKREKKEKKKKDKEAKSKGKDNQPDSLTEKLYTELPETSFTRTISNPEAVMKRRRQQKVEKLQMLRAAEGTTAGDAVKIYGESLCPDVPYKTLVLSTIDRAGDVVIATLEKYGMEKENPANYCLIKVVYPPNGSPPQDELLGNDQCPMIVLLQHNPRKGEILLQIRRRTDGQHLPQETRGQPTMSQQRPFVGNANDQQSGVEKLPFLIELNPDGTEPYNPSLHSLHLDMTEIGSGQQLGISANYIQLIGPNILPRHCVIAHAEGIVTATPIDRDAEIYIDNIRIFETTFVQDNSTLRFGSSVLFKFVDPSAGERRSRPDGGVPNSPNRRSMERPYDKDYAIENRQNPVDDMPTNMNPDDSFIQQGGEVQEKLPASLEFRENEEDRFLTSLIIEVDPLAVMFKLAPTYSLYMAARYVLSDRGQRPGDYGNRLTNFTIKLTRMIHHTIQDNRDSAAALSFWMANASELLNFFKHDRDMQRFTLDAQDILADAVQVAFKQLVLCLERDLQQAMPTFLDKHDIDTDDSWMNGEVLATMSAAMSLLRRCRVNAALTIQLFSQLFHFINMWLFNQLVLEPRLQLCSRVWGRRLRRRLACVETWAEKQGLELAADCHLARILQATDLLEMPKNDLNALINCSPSWFKLNSLQVHILLKNYITMNDEPPFPHDFINEMVRIAESSNDELIRSEGHEIHLEEDPDLHLPFLLPEDGYSCEIVRGLPNGLPEYLDPLCKTGICFLMINHDSPGVWKIYLGNPLQPNVSSPQSSVDFSKNEPPQSTNRPNISFISFNKVKGSMGLSIVATKGEGQEKRGIYIKSVVPNGAAALDGRLTAGDQLLAVDNQSLIGVSQERAAELMVKTGDRVTLKVAKQAAVFHGLAPLLNQPSPEVQRAALQRQISESPSTYSTDVNDGSVTLKRRYKGVAKSSPQLNDGTGNRGAPFIRPAQPIIKPAYGQTIPKDANRSKSTSNLDDDDHSRPRSRIHSSSTLPHKHTPRNAKQKVGPTVNPHSKSNPDLANQTASRYPSTNSTNQQVYTPTDARGYGPITPTNSRYESSYESSRHSPRLEDSFQDSTPYQLKSEHEDDLKLREWQQRFNERPVSSNQSHQNGVASQPIANYQAELPHPSRDKNMELESRYSGDSQIHNTSYMSENQQNIETNYVKSNRNSYHDELEIPRRKNEPTQASFYESTQPLDREMTPPFFQLQSKEFPTVAPKPKVAPKPDHNKIVPHEIPKAEIDNTKTQAHFYHDWEPKPVQPPTNQQHPSSMYNQSQDYPSQRNFDHRASHNPVEANSSSFYGNRSNTFDAMTGFNTSMKGGPESPDFPPPPVDDLPPPPDDDNQVPDIHDFPPPPPTAYPYEHDFRDPYGKQLPENERYQIPRLNLKEKANQPNVQNINYERDGNRSHMGNSSLNSQDKFISPWEKEEKDAEAKQRLNELGRMMDMEVADLEGRTHLSPQDIKRLQHLKLEQEFSRRVKEVDDKGEMYDDDDSKDDPLDKAATRQKFAGMIREGLEKSQSLRKQQNEIDRVKEIEREREFKERKERMLQIHDAEREEQKQRLQRKHERLDREHEERMMKQKEISGSYGMKDVPNPAYNVQQEQMRSRNNQRPVSSNFNGEQNNPARPEFVPANFDRPQFVPAKSERNDKVPPTRPQFVAPTRPEFVAPTRPEFVPNFERPEFVPANFQNSRNDQSQDGLPPPPPPQRNSSYAPMYQTYSPSRQHTSSANQTVSDMPFKKSVSFNSNLTTEIDKKGTGIPASLSMQGFMPYEPTTSRNQRNSSTSSSGGFQPHTPTSPMFEDRPQFGPQTLEKPRTQQVTYGNEVAGTPSVIGAQEVYRDPRSRIEAKRHSQHEDTKDLGEKMSFKEKMKLFALEAGESTPVEKSRSSRTQILLEHQFASPQ